MSKVHNEERHPNGVPKTIHHYEGGKPVYHHEVVPMDVEELTALGHSKTEAAAMRNEALQNSGAGEGKEAATTGAYGR
jgi:hypothetical protein